MKGISKINGGIVDNFFVYTNFQMDSSGKIFFCAFDSLYELNSETKEWNYIPLKFPLIYDLRYAEGTFFFLDGVNLWATSDEFKNFQIICPATKGSKSYPELYATKKGTLFLSDTNGVFWRGVNSTRVKENSIINPNISISPNPAEDFIEIIGLAENENWEIFNVLGLKMAVGHLFSAHFLEIGVSH